MKNIKSLNVVTTGSDVNCRAGILDALLINIPHLSKAVRALPATASSVGITRATEKDLLV